jgi:hypothetical protein
MRYRSRVTLLYLALIVGAVVSFASQEPCVKPHSGLGLRFGINYDLVAIPRYVLFCIRKYVVVSGPSEKKILDSPAGDFGDDGHWKYAGVAINVPFWSQINLPIFVGNSGIPEVCKRKVIGHLWHPLHAGVEGHILGWSTAAIFPMNSEFNTRCSFAVRSEDLIGHPFWENESSLDRYHGIFGGIRRTFGSVCGASGLSSLSDGLLGERMCILRSSPISHFFQSLDRSFRGRLGGMCSNFGSVGTSIIFEPLPSRVSNGKEQQQQGERGETNSQPVSQQLGIKRRITFCSGGILLSLSLAMGGFRLIQSAGCIEDVSLPNIIKVVCGFGLIGLAWMLTQAALDVLDFGRVYMGSLI